VAESKPLVVADATPRAPRTILTDEIRERLEERVELQMHDGPVPDELIDARAESSRRPERRWLAPSSVTDRRLCSSS
jgi:hypothetical protein